MCVYSGTPFFCDNDTGRSFEAIELKFQQRLRFGSGRSGSLLVCIVIGKRKMRFPVDFPNFPGNRESIGGMELEG